MASVNKVILIGNLGRDPEARKTASGASVCSFSLATTEKWADKQGQRHEETEWHNVTAWNKQAETMVQYLSKGSQVYIEGKLKTQSWEDNGQKKYKTEVVVQNFQFIGGKQEGQHHNQGGFGQPQQQQSQGSFGQPQGQGFPQQNQGSFGQPQQQNNFNQQQPPQNLPIENELPF